MRFLGSAARAASLLQVILDASSGLRRLVRKIEDLGYDVEVKRAA